MNKLTVTEILSKLNDLVEEKKLTVKFYAQYEDERYDDEGEEQYEFNDDDKFDTPEILAEVERLKKISDRGWSHESKAYVNLLGLGEIIEVEQEGGSEQGSSWHTVKYFKDHDVYIRTDGYYSSYEGTEFYNGFGYEVKPEQVMITVYKKV